MVPVPEEDLPVVLPEDLIPDGSEWFLVSEQMLLDLTKELNAVLVDPLKTTIVQDYRCMTTWVLRKRRG